MIMLPPSILKKYDHMINMAIVSHNLRDLTRYDGSCWISTNVFVWSKEDIHDLMVTIKPHDSMDQKHNYAIDIEHHRIRIRHVEHSNHIDIPHISTEEEYFQVSTLEDISMFPLEMYIKIRELFDKVAEKCCGVYK